MPKPKILVVDDEKPTRDVLAKALSPMYECLVAPDAEAALAILADNPDTALVLTDYKMPGEDGELDVYSDGFRALKEIGYDKFVSFECGLAGEDRAAAVTNAVNLLRKQWEEA